MAKRSIGVILNVTLLAWSVNLLFVACSGPNSRAAVLVSAGASPAAKPEPSPSRHNCCPRKSVHATQVSFSPAEFCPLLAPPAMNCCGATHDLVYVTVSWAFHEPDHSRVVVGYNLVAGFNPLHTGDTLFSSVRGAPESPPLSDLVLRL